MLEDKGWGVEGSSVALLEPALQNWHLLVDQSGQLSLKEVQAERALFKRLDSPSYASMGSHKAVWMHVQVPAHGDVRWLRVAARHVEYLDLYLLRAGQLEQHIQSGEYRERGAGIPMVSPYLFLLPADGQPRDAYLRLQSNHPMMAYFQLVGEEGLATLERAAYFHGALLGMLALLVLYNLLYFAGAGYTCYAWLSLFHLALLGCLAANLGLVAAWWPTQASRQSLIADLMPLFSCMALLAFCLNFFRHQNSAGASWFLRIGFYLLALEALVMPLTAWPWHGLLAHILALVAGVGALAVSFQHWLHGNRPARLSTAGLLVLSLCLLCFLALPAGYQMLDAEGLIGSLFWLAALGGLLLNLALLDQQRQRPKDVLVAPKPSENNRSQEYWLREALLTRLNHELRGPLNNVLGMSELLLDTSLSAKQRDYVQSMQGAGNELLNLVNEILDIPQLVSGDMALDCQSVDFAGLLTDCFEILQPRAEQQGVKLVSSIHPQVPTAISTDPLRLRQLLMGLLDNALRNSTAGGYVVLQAALIEDPDQDAALLHISVQDEGPLVSAATQAILLDKSPKPCQVLAKIPSGMAVSLFIAREMARLMRGEFGIQPAQTQGNLLWVSLPLARTPVDAAESYVMVAALKGVRVLVVDDNETSRKVLLKQCTGWGMEVDTVADAKEALALLRTRAHLSDLFDVVLLEQDMPGMTGLQLAMKIKSDLAFNHDLSLILLTGVNQPPSPIDARNAGVNRMLTKPVSSYSLKTVLVDELSKRPVHQVALSGDQAAPFSIPEDFRILIAEDDRASSRVICSMLAKFDVKPDVVSNGEQALEALKKHPYDLVLMDCEMPVLDGYGATRLLRDWEAADPARPHTFVVALTAHVLTEHQEQAEQAGMDAYMAKPIELSRLRALIRQRVSAKMQHHVQEEGALPHSSLGDTG